jgi:hypothetical protein
VIEIVGTLYEMSTVGGSMNRAAESWRVSEVFHDPQLKQWVASWEQAHAPRLTPHQRQVLTEIATCVRDLEAERALDGDHPLKELSRDARRWAEFLVDHADVKKRYNRVMARAVRQGLFASPQYCRRYDRDRHSHIGVRYGVLDEAHPLVSEWVRLRRAFGDTVLHCFWRTTHAVLDHGVPLLLLGHEGEAGLAEKVVECRQKGQSWGTIYRLLQAKGQLLRDKQGVVRHTSAEALRKWALAQDLEEAPPAEMPRRERRALQQREGHEKQQRAEIIRTLELTPQSSDGYIARVHTTSGEQVEAQGQDEIGTFLKLTQSLWYRYPGETPQQVSDT